MLEKTLRRLRMRLLARDVFESRPSLAVASLRFVWLVSPTLIYPYGTRTIADLCLGNAFIAASQDVPDVGSAFIGGLLANVSMLLELRVSHGLLHWDPLVDSPLMTWMQDHPEAVVEPADDHLGVLPPLRQFACAIARRILEPVDYHYIDALAEVEP